MHRAGARRLIVVVTTAVLASAGASAVAQVPGLPPVPTVTPPPVPELPPPPVPVPELPAPIPDVPDLPSVPDAPDLPAPVPDVPDTPAVPALPGAGGGDDGGGRVEPRVGGGSAGSGSAGGGSAGAGNPTGSDAGGGRTAGGSPGTAGRGEQAAPAVRAGATTRRARAAAVRPTPRERRERRLRRTVARLSACLDTLRPTQRRVLVLRAGVGDAAPLSRAAVADRLDTRVRAVRRAERRGLRSLRASARAGACGGGGGGAAAAPVLASATYDVDAIRGSGRGDGAIGTVTGRVGEPGRSGVKDEFRSGPGGIPRGTLTPPVQGSDGGPPLLLLLALAFVAGFAAVWTVERRRA